MLRPVSKYMKQFADKTISLGLPINEEGYIQDEFLLLPQFQDEYAAQSVDIASEVNTGRLKIFMRDTTILIARRDAENWAVRLEDYAPFSSPKDIENESDAEGDEDVEA